MAGTSGGGLNPRRRGRAAQGGAAVFAGKAQRRSDRSGVDEPAPWRSRRLLRLATALTVLALLIFAAWLVWVGYLFFVRGRPSGLAFDPDRRCSSLSFSCGILTNLLASVVLVALASSFLLWRLFGLQRRYRARARDESRELVPTAGAIIDKVVGRDDLCKAVMADLHDRGNRPHVLVGGVGTGKTAVLVRLTELLAEKRAIPVPVRLRDATSELDFQVLARERFLSEVNPGLLSPAEGETIWRRLIKDRKIIVLADGLEEALAADPERDNIIRAAIRKAHQQHLPLVIASRPHDPLRATEAAMLTLEPLSYEAALAYIAGDRQGEDERRLAWIVETAEVMEAPLYLQITRELQVKGLLEPASAGQHGVVDTRGVDRSKLRLGLLQTWERALIRGHLREEVPLNRSERHAAIEYLSALACAGLKLDRLEVEFDDLQDESISSEVQRRLASIDEQAGPATSVINVDLRLAAAWAAQLDLVELRGNSIRFPHSLMQAYLGSRLLNSAWQDPAYVREATRHPKPSRELLIALVLRSRAAPDAGGAPAGSGRAEPARRARRSGRDGAVAPKAGSDYVGALRHAAIARDDNKVLDIYAAALEVDSFAPQPEHVTIAAEIGGRWSRIHAQDPRTLEEGKSAVVHRFGEAARALDERRKQGEDCPVPAYSQLYLIGCADRSYHVQLAAAQEIGISGYAAYAALRDMLEAPCRTCEAERTERAQTPAESPGPVPPADRARAAIMSAWLAPMLAGSVGGQGTGAAERLAAQHAQADLAQWLRHLGQDGRQAAEEDLPISLEIALAQGFKYAANRRPGQPDNLREARMYLAEQALEMLKSARYWFSQLTLLHALCLLSLSEGTKQADDKRRAQPEAIVRHWLDVAGRDRADRGRAGGPAGLHPFVREAAQLVVLALRSRRPQRYCWIDESGVVGQVGSRNLSQDTPHGRHHLWIPPSAGWTALDGRSQQLVADVLLLLNLADRGGQASERERRLKRSNRSDLPPCITNYRDALEPARTIGTAVSSAPGISCVDGCAFELCPYPPKGTQPRVEMSEAFCRRQQTLVIRPGDPRTGRAPWQQMRPAQLTRFWVEMGDRARGQRLRSGTFDRNDSA